MNQKEIRELVEFLVEKDIREFELERGDVKVRIKRGAEAAAPAPVYQVAAAAPMVAPPAGAAGGARPGGGGAEPSAAHPHGGEDLHIIKSPIVGTFYESPSPGSPAFVKPGDRIEDGQVLCIIEAMKLMNEIEADATGEVVKQLVTNGQPVEYGQPLFSVRTK